MEGQKIYELAKKIWPINRSITGDGVRETLSILSEINKNLKIFEIASGTECFDWNVPKEWRITEAWIKDDKGRVIVDFLNNNLHVMGYSVPVDCFLSLEELQKHLYSLKDQPDLIPYVTSYYQENWGFCICQNERDALESGIYHAHIKSEIFDGVMNYGEIIIPGNTSEEIFLSTYICHPSMANNELSGPCLTIFLANWISTLKDRRYTYRIVFLPETIGSICYLSKHAELMKKRTLAGFVITCVGDDNMWSFLPSLKGNTLGDRIVAHVLKHIAKDGKYNEYSFINDRGSDERQYCSPGIDLPICSLMRSKYGEYKEYHTSADDLNFISPEGLNNSFEAYKRVIEIIEYNSYPKATYSCEPNLGKRNLYPLVSTKESWAHVSVIINILALSDGKRSILDIAELINLPASAVKEKVKLLCSEGLLETNTDAF
jgi:aminopeptidase-like protein